MPQRDTDPSAPLAHTLLKVALPAVAVSALLVLGAWWLYTGNAPDSVSPTSADRAGTPTATRTSEARPSDDPMLAARNALNEQRVLAPPGDNAVEYYLQALSQDPDNVAARQALLELIPTAADAVQGSISAGELDEAQRRLHLLKRMGISELRLNLVRNELANARAQREQQAAMALAREAESVAATNPAADAAPVRTTPIPSAAPPAAASTLRADASSAAPAQSNSPAPAMPAPAATEPVPTAATVAAPVLRVEEPRQIVDAAPAYPSQALQRRIEGVVELEFRVERDGSVSDIQVVASDPPRMFDREAVRAAQRWRFEPRRENGVAVESRVRKSLQFRLKLSRAG